MHTKEALKDIHQRTHRSFQKLMQHCEVFSEKDLHSEYAGFGYASLQLQIHHLCAAESYWIRVLMGRHDWEDNPELYGSMALLEAYRSTVVSQSLDFLDSLSPQQLNATRAVKTWQGKTEHLVPAIVFMRPLSHIFMHMGQITAICRLLGRPINGVDYPLD